MTDLAERPVLAPATSPRRPRWGAASATFAVVSLLFGTMFALLVPSFWGHDEISHFSRAYQVAHGGILPEQIYSDPRGLSFGGQLPSTIVDLMDLAFEDFYNNPPEPAPMVADPSAYDRLGGYPVSSQTRDQWFTNTAAYSPVPYLPAVASIRASEALGFSVRRTLTSARLAGLLFSTLVIALALQSLKGRRLAWLGVAVGLVPMSVFLSGTVTADTMTNAVAFLVSVLFIKARFLGERLSRVESFALLAGVIVLPLCKPLYVLLALLGALVPRDRLSGLPAVRLVPQAAAVLSLALLAAWTSVSAVTTNGMGAMRPQAQWHSVLPAQQMAGVLAQPVGFLRTFLRTIGLRDELYYVQFFGELGSGWVKVPALSVVLASLALLVAFGISERLQPARWVMWTCSLVVLLTVGVIFGTLYLSFSPVGFYIIDGVQGRYFLPLTLVVGAVLLRLVPMRLAGPGGQLAVRGPAIAVVILSVGALTAALLRYLLVLHGWV